MHVHWSLKTKTKYRLKFLLLLPPAEQPLCRHLKHIHVWISSGSHFLTLQTQTGLMSAAPSLKLLIWFRPFKRHTYILFLRLCHVTKPTTHKYSGRLHLLFRTSLPLLLTNKFNKTFILTNYRLLLPATLQKISSSSFFPPHTHTHFCTIATHRLLCTVDLKPWALPSIPTML